jgi:cGMP-dependent protein kinase
MLSADNQKMAMTLGYLTETGEYPEDPNRTNQDSFIGKFAFPNPFVPSPFHFPSFFAHIWLAVIRDFNNDPSSLFLSVFDGHGPKGTPCSVFARHFLPVYLTTALRHTRKPEVALAAAYMHTNSQMHAQSESSTTKKWESRVSGTTAACCLLINNTLYTANAGDSRVVIGSEGDSRVVIGSEVSAGVLTAVDEGTAGSSGRAAGAAGGSGKLKAQALSHDHTPYRRDERMRVRAAGANVCSRKQHQGTCELHDDWDVALGEVIDTSADPPRIWDGENEFPGSAFTRSLGDGVAEKLGVFAMPEIETRKLKPSDKYVHAQYM